MSDKKPRRASLEGTYDEERCTEYADRGLALEQRRLTGEARKYTNFVRLLSSFYFHRWSNVPSVRCLRMLKCMFITNKGTVLASPVSGETSNKGSRSTLDEKSYLRQCQYPPRDGNLVIWAAGELLILCSRFPYCRCAVLSDTLFKQLRLRTAKMTPAIRLRDSLMTLKPTIHRLDRSYDVLRPPPLPDRHNSRHWISLSVGPCVGSRLARHASSDLTSHCPALSHLCTLDLASGRADAI